MHPRGGGLPDGRRRCVVAALAALLALAALTACTTPPASSHTPGSPDGGTLGAERISVVASTTVFADLVRQVGGDRVEVHALIPAGRDAHTFEPAPSDLARLASAQLMVINGLGLDDSLEQLARDAAPADLPIVALGKDLDGVAYLAGDDDHADEAINPHLWLDVSYARRYVERIADALIEVDPPDRSSYQARAAAYDERLAALDEWTRQELDAISADNRRVVSFHDAFPYFARAYGLEIVGVVVDVPGQEPSAGEVTRLVDAIRQADVRAILSEVQFSDRLAVALAEQTDAAVVHDLYTDSLGDPPLDTFEQAMRWNVEQITDALR